MEAGGNYSYIYQTGGEGRRRYWKCLSIKTCQQGLNYRSPSEKCEGLDARVAADSSSQLSQPIQSEPIDGDPLSPKWTAFPSDNAPKLGEMNPVRAPRTGGRLRDLP